MKVDVLFAAGCPSCLHDLAALRAAAHGADPTVDWHELDIVDAIDYAVELGVLRPPAVAIDGQLAFQSLPAPLALVSAMRMRRGA